MGELIDPSLENRTLRFDVNEVEVEGHFTHYVRGVRVADVAFDNIVLHRDRFLAPKGFL